MQPSSKSDQCVIHGLVSVEGKNTAGAKSLFLALGPVRRAGRGLPSPLTTAACLGVFLLFVGCSAPAVRQQRLVSKPNMTFSDSAVFTYSSPRLLPQIGPGFPGGDASQNSGCTSCR